MASPGRDQAVGKKLVENLQGDLRALSAEGKRKFPSVKEVQYFVLGWKPSQGRNARKMSVTRQKCKKIGDFSAQGWNLPTMHMPTC